VRSLPVLHLLPDGCELGVGNYDRDLVEGIQLVALAIRLDGDTLLSAPAEITRSVSHRGRPIRARARWLRLDSATRRRLMHLLPREGGEPGT
jgi:hypothetical protein